MFILASSKGGKEKKTDFFSSTGFAGFCAGGRDKPAGNQSNESNESNYSETGRTENPYDRLS